MVSLREGEGAARQQRNHLGGREVAIRDENGRLRHHPDHFAGRRRIVIVPLARFVAEKGDLHAGVAAQPVKCLRNCPFWSRLGRAIVH